MHAEVLRRSGRTLKIGQMMSCISSMKRCGGIRKYRTQEERAKAAKFFDQISTSWSLLPFVIQTSLTTFGPEKSSGWRSSLAWTARNFRCPICGEKAVRCDGLGRFFSANHISDNEKNGVWRGSFGHLRKTWRCWLQRIDGNSQAASGISGLPKTLRKPPGKQTKRLKNSLGFPQGIWKHLKSLVFFVAPAMCFFGFWRFGERPRLGSSCGLLSLGMLGAMAGLPGWTVMVKKVLCFFQEMTKRHELFYIKSFTPIWGLSDPKMFQSTSQHLTSLRKNKSTRAAAYATPLQPLPRLKLKQNERHNRWTPRIQKLATRRRVLLGESKQRLKWLSLTDSNCGCGSNESKRGT